MQDHSKYHLLSDHTLWREIIMRIRLFMCKPKRTVHLFMNFLVLFMISTLSLVSAVNLSFGYRDVIAKLFTLLIIYLTYLSLFVKISVDFRRILGRVIHSTRAPFDLGNRNRYLMPTINFFHAYSGKPI